MKTRTWVILGATSIIAEQFAHLAAQAGQSLLLVARDDEQLAIIANDMKLRYQVPCELISLNMAGTIDKLLAIFDQRVGELDLLIAHSDFTGNNRLDAKTITRLIKINILATVQLIHGYLNLKQTQHHLIYLSSVAACRGRARNSLYGGSKAAIEIYLQGLQQAAASTQHIMIARLGFIDTRQTFGLSGIFYAASPEACAAACWKAMKRKKRMLYFPAFWRGIVVIITRLPFFIYKRSGI